MFALAWGLTVNQMFLLGQGSFQFDLKPLNIFEIYIQYSISLF